MSLYTGKVSNQPILHLTTSDTSINSMRTTTPLANTSFLSSSRFVAMRKVKTVSGSIRTYDPFGSGGSKPIKYLHFNHGVNMTSTSTRYLLLGNNPYTNAGISYNNIVLTGLDSYSLPSGFHKNAYGVESDAMSYCVYGLGGGWNDSAYEAPRYAATIDIYEFYEVDNTVSSGNISIGSGNITLGSFDMLAHSYLSFTKINDKDKEYSSPYMYMQILNSFVEGGIRSVGLDNRYISVTTASGTYPIFGTSHKYNSKIVQSYTQSGVSIIKLNFPSSTAIALVSGYFVHFRTYYFSIVAKQGQYQVETKLEMDPTGTEFFESFGYQSTTGGIGIQVGTYFHLDSTVRYSPNYKAYNVFVQMID